VVACDLLLHPYVGFGGIRMTAQVIAEQERIALVGIPRDTHMDVGRSHPFPLLEIPLPPVLGILIAARRNVICVCLSTHVAGTLNCLLYYRSQISHGHLQIDLILGSQTFYRS